MRKMQDLKTEFDLAKCAVKSNNPNGPVRQLLICAAPGGGAKAQILFDGDVDIISVVGFSAESNGEHLHTVDEHQLGSCHSVEMLDTHSFTFSSLEVESVIDPDDTLIDAMRPRLQEQS